MTVAEARPRSGHRVHVEDSHEAIDLIDILRAHGLEAELADVPGDWDVDAEGPLEEISEIIERELSRHERLR